MAITYTYYDYTNAKFPILKASILGSKKLTFLHQTGIKTSSALNIMVDCGVTSDDSAVEVVVMFFFQEMITVSPIAVVNFLTLKH
jgi:hypothetical protein